MKARVELDKEMDGRPCLLILASTYPRWRDDPEPAFIHELAKRLCRWFQVHVLCPHAKGAAPSEIMDDVHVHRYRYAPQRWETLVNDGGIVTNLKHHPLKAVLLPGFVLSQAWMAWRLCRRMRVDVIHAHWIVPQGLLAAGLQYLPGNRVPFIVTSHGADLYALKGRVFDWIRRFVLRRASAATVVSTAMRESLRSPDVDADRIAVLSMGVDVNSRFKPGIGMSRSRNEILFVGRLVEKKGLGYLMRALPGIFRQHPDAFLSIAGFGPEEQALRSAVADLGLLDKVQFLGGLPQAELPALYARAAVFVAPFIQAESGDQEGLPVALMEAIACGCPVLAGDVSGLHDMLGEHAACVTLDPRDIGEIERRVASVLSSPDEARARAKQMSVFVRDRFDWDRIAAEYALVLESALRAQPD